MNERHSNYEKTKYNLLMDECNKYPPNLPRIEEMLSELDSIDELYSQNGRNTDGYWVCTGYDFLSTFIANYIDEAVKNGTQTLMYAESYAKEIIELFLKHGYDMKAMDGKVGTACLHALIWSYFQVELVSIASLFLAAGADPELKSEYGETVLETMERLHGKTLLDRSKSKESCDERDEVEVTFYNMCKEHIKENRGEAVC